MRTLRETLRTWTRTNNKRNPDITPGSGIEPRPHRWEASSEDLPGILGNKGTLAKYRRQQGNISQFLVTGEQNSKKLQYENIRKMCGNMGT